MNALLCECEFEIDTRAGHCQRFVTSLVVLLRLATGSDYAGEGTVSRGLGFSSLSEKTRKPNHLQISSLSCFFLLLGGW